MAKRQDFHHVPGAGTTSKHLKWVLGCCAAHRSGAFMARGWRYLRERGMRLSEDVGLGPPRQPLIAASITLAPGRRRQTEPYQAVLGKGRT